MPIVVKIPEKVKAGGAKGHYYERRTEQTKLVKIEKGVSKERRRVGSGGAVQEKEERTERLRKGSVIAAGTISESQTGKGL